MRSQHPPAVPGLHPHIGQPVVILVRLALRQPLFMVRARNHGDAAVHPHSQVRQLGHFNLDRRVSAVRDITRFAVSVAILNRDDELFSQERRQDVDTAFLVSLSPLFFQPPHLRRRARRLLRSQANRQHSEQAESQPRSFANPHAFYVIPTSSSTTSSECNKPQNAGQSGHTPHPTTHARIRRTSEAGASTSITTSPS